MRSPDSSEANLVTPEVELWQAVITRAVIDATAEERPAAPVTRNGRKRTAEQIQKLAALAAKPRDEARRWLLSNSEDYRLVCSFANLDPGMVRETAERLKANGWIQTETDLCVRTAKDSGGDGCQKNQTLKENINV